MKIVDINNEDKLRLQYGIPEIEILRKADIVVAMNKNTGNAVILKCRLDLSESGIEELEYTEIGFEDRKKLELYEHKNVVLAEDMFTRDREAMKIIDSI